MEKFVQAWNFSIKTLHKFSLGLKYHAKIWRPWRKPNIDFSSSRFRHFLKVNSEFFHFCVVAWKRLIVKIFRAQMNLKLASKSIDFTKQFVNWKLTLLTEKSIRLLSTRPLNEIRVGNENLTTNCFARWCRCWWVWNF